MKGTLTAVWIILRLFWMFLAAVTIAAAYDRFVTFGANPWSWHEKAFFTANVLLGIVCFIPLSHITMTRGLRIFVGLFYGALSAWHLTQFLGLNPFMAGRDEELGIIREPSLVWILVIYALAPAAIFLHALNRRRTEAMDRDVA